MLVKINGTPVDEVVQELSDTAEILKNTLTTPVNVNIAIGNHHITSADFNPINSPHHIVDGFIHLPEKLSAAFDFVSHLI
jgi:hypothetical protein